LRVGAAMLSLAGVAEGSQIALPILLPATNLTFTATVSGVGGSPEVMFSLEGQGAVFQRRTSGVPYSVIFTNLSAGKYFLLAEVVTATNLSADLSFDIAASTSQPANDLWSNAIAIANIGTDLLGTNTHTTAEPNEPLHAENGAGRSVWWSWQASINGIITATTAGSGFDTVLAIYTGTNVSALSQVGANDDAGSTNRSSQVSFSAVAGTKYYIAVDSAVSADGSAESGQVHLRLLNAVPPSVPAFADERSGCGLHAVADKSRSQRIHQRFGRGRTRRIRSGWRNGFPSWSAINPLPMEPHQFAARRLFADGQRPQQSGFD